MGKENTDKRHQQSAGGCKFMKDDIKRWMVVGSRLVVVVSDGDAKHEMAA